MFIVRVASDEFGVEEFVYDTMVEALQAIERLFRVANSLRDGIVRVIGLVVNREV